MATCWSGSALSVSNRWRAALAAGRFVGIYMLTYSLRLRRRMRSASFVIAQKRIPGRGATVAALRAGSSLNTSGNSSPSVGSKRCISRYSSTTVPLCIGRAPYSSGPSADGEFRHPGQRRAMAPLCLDRRRPGVCIAGLMSICVDCRLLTAAESSRSAARWAQASGMSRRQPRHSR